MGCVGDAMFEVAALDAACATEIARSDIASRLPASATGVINFAFCVGASAGLDGFAGSAGAYGRGSGEGASGSIQVGSARFAANTSEDDRVCVFDSTCRFWEPLALGVEAICPRLCPPRPRSTAIGTIINSSRIRISSVASSLCRACAIDCTTPCAINSAIDDEAPGIVADFATPWTNPVGTASDRRD